VSLASGAEFERFIDVPFGPPSEKHLGHMQLTRGHFDGAIPLEAFRMEWNAFLSEQGDPIVAAWNQSTLDLLAGAAGAMAQPASNASLKSAYRNVFGASTGCVEDVVASSELAVGPSRFAGRAGRRVAYAIAVARHLNARALRVGV
jgi:hypothetical protein